MLSDQSSKLPTSYEFRRRLNPALRGMILLIHLILISAWILISDQGLYQIFSALQMMILNGSYIAIVSFLLTWLVTFPLVVLLMNFLGRFEALTNTNPILTRRGYAINILLCCGFFLLPGVYYLCDGYHIKDQVEISLKDLEEGKISEVRAVAMQAYVLPDKIQSLKPESAYTLTYRVDYIPFVSDPSTSADKLVTVLLKTETDNMPADLENLLAQKDKDQPKSIFVEGLLSKNSLNLYIKSRLKDSGLHLADPYYVLDISENKSDVLLLGKISLIAGGVFSLLLLIGFWLWFRKEI